MIHDSESKIKSLGIKHPHKNFLPPYFHRIRKQLVPLPAGIASIGRVEMIFMIGANNSPPYIEPSLA